MLLDRCGMSHKEAAAFHKTKIETVNAWATGKKASPEDANYALCELYLMIQTMAFDTVDMIDEQNPEGVELDAAQSDEEAQELGLPCVGAHRAALAIVVALCGRPVVLAKHTANDQ